MSNALATIDHADMSAVSGGLEIRSWWRAATNKAPTMNVEVRQTQYEKCLGDVTSRAGWTAQHLKTACGFPPAQ